MTYIRLQEVETRRAYRELEKENEDLGHFSNATNIYVDTTQMSTNEVFELVMKRLTELKVL